MKSILLQYKFLLVEWLNVTYQIVPNPLRNLYLRCKYSVTRVLRTS